MTDTETLFAHYHDRLFRYLSRAAGRANNAGDLTQEVFLRVSRSAIPVAPDGQVAAWLFRIARNVVLDYHRQRHRLNDETLPQWEGTRPAPQETVVAINEALATLADLDRDVFLMRELVGLGYQEIASACELTPDAVRSRLCRVRLQLREMLAAPVRMRRTERMRQSGRPI